MSRPVRQVTQSARGFTLIELMISVAIALVLILAVNRVFRVTSDTIGAGQTLSSKGRDFRAVRSSFYNDLTMSVPPQAAGSSTLDDGPFLVIRSERIMMFRNRADQLADRDADPATSDVDADNTEGEAGVPGEVVRTTDLNDRSHRLDRLMFFARGQFRRQTGGDIASGGRVPFQAEMSSPEAFVWYGHLQLPDYSTPTADQRRYATRRPGERVPSSSPLGQLQPKNPLNFYAADWTLGRVAIGLTEGADESNDGVGDLIYDDHGQPQLFYRRSAGLLDAGSLAPIRANVGTGGAVRSDDGWELEWGRYDVANTSITQYRQILGRYISANPSTGPLAWYNLVSALQFQADPFPRRPVTAADLARTVPVFLPNCSQFAVEFAGDFVTQKVDDPYRSPNENVPDGTVMSNTPDDRIDFVVLPDKSHNVRWYGFPRDTTGDGRIPVVARGNANQMPDVVPLRDVRRTAVNLRPGEMDGAPFERMRDERGRQRLPLPSGGDYARSTSPDASYVVAWGPDTAALPRPQMLRIVFTLDDPAGRLNAAQTYEYVIKLP
jgi:prepilin-type N-terminal cleavage/methylation domain-containing protein